MPSTGDRGLYNHLKPYPIPDDFFRSALGIHLNASEARQASTDTRIFALNNDVNPDGVGSILWSAGDAGQNATDVMCIVSSTPTQSCRHDCDCAAGELCYRRHRSGACRRTRVTVYDEMLYSYVDSHSDVIMGSCSGAARLGENHLARDRCCHFQPAPATAVLLAPLK